MTTLQLSTATTFCVSLLRERPQDSYVHLKSYQVEVLHHSDPADRLRDAAHFHIGRDPELQRFASPEIVTLEHFLVRGMCGFLIAQRFITALAVLGATPTWEVAMGEIGPPGCKRGSLGL